MRKLIAVAAFALLTGLLGSPVSAHGTCTAKALKPVRSGGTVFFTGSYDCNGTFHSITVTVFAQRRAGGSTGSFSNITSSGASNPNTTVQGAQANLPFDCNKDYRTRTVGKATFGGVTHSGSANSAILQNTC